MTEPAVVGPSLLRRLALPALGRAADKESRGRAMVVAGSREVPGAALLAGEAALRAGAGKLLVATLASASTGLALRLPEARVVALPESDRGDIEPNAAASLYEALERTDALLVGPGMLDESAATALAQSLLRCARGRPVVLDAAAMAACRHADPADTVLITPHAGELAHLSGSDKPSIEEDPVRAARQAARAWNAVVALKGATTVIAAPTGEAWIHHADCAGLATAGSGDVLAGLIAGLIARGARLEQAAIWGVFLNAQAGQRLAQREGSIGFLARDLAREVPALVDEISAGLASQQDPARG